MNKTHIKYFDRGFSMIELFQDILIGGFRYLQEKAKYIFYGYVPVLCIDFDGVIHSYTSGWQGVRNIPDPPVEGAIEWLDSLVEDGDSVCSMAPRFKEFDVCIYSSRSSQFGGRRAMRNWLVKYGFPEDKLENIRFPLIKPAAILTIDDRAVCFNGKFPTIKEMQNFKTWQKKDKI